jgi:hypothetical protein
LGKHAASEQGSDLKGVDLIVFSFSSMDGFHVEGMAEDEGDVFLGTEVGDPVPGEHAFYGDHDVLTKGSNDTEKGFRVCVDVLMNPDIASGIKDADKHIFGMQVDSTIKFVLFGVKFHIGFLLLMGYGVAVTSSVPSLGGGLE